MGRRKAYEYFRSHRATWGAFLARVIHMLMQLEYLPWNYFCAGHYLTRPDGTTEVFLTLNGGVARDL